MPQKIDELYSRLEIAFPASKGKGNYNAFASKISSSEDVGMQVFSDLSNRNGLPEGVTTFEDFKMYYGLYGGKPKVEQTVAAEVTQPVPVVTQPVAEVSPLAKLAMSAERKPSVTTLPTKTTEAQQMLGVTGNMKSYEVSKVLSNAKAITHNQLNPGNPVKTIEQLRQENPVATEGAIMEIYERQFPKSKPQAMDIDSFKAVRSRIVNDAMPGEVPLVNITEYAKVGEPLTLPGVSAANANDKKKYANYIALENDFYSDVNNLAYNVFKDNPQLQNTGLTVERLAQHFQNITHPTGEQGKRTPKQLALRYYEAFHGSDERMGIPMSKEFIAKDKEGVLRELIGGALAEEMNVVKRDIAIGEQRGELKTVERLKKLGDLEQALAARQKKLQQDIEIKKADNAAFPGRDLNKEVQDLNNDIESFSKMRSEVTDEQVQGASAFVQDINRSKSISAAYNKFNNLTPLLNEEEALAKARKIAMESTGPITGFTGGFAEGAKEAWNNAVPKMINSVSSLAMPLLIGASDETKERAEKTLRWTTDTVDNISFDTSVSPLIKDNGDIDWSELGRVVGGAVGTIAGIGSITGAVSKVAGMTPATLIAGFSASYKDYFDEAISRGLNFDTAIGYATRSATVQAVSELIMPDIKLMEGVRTGIFKSVDDVIEQFARNGGKINDWNVIKRGALASAKPIVMENIEELAAMGGDLANNMLTNGIMGREVFDEAPSMNEIKETAIVTTLATLLVGSPGMIRGARGGWNADAQRSFYHASKDIVSFNAAIDSLEASGAITTDVATASKKQAAKFQIINSQDIPKGVELTDEQRQEISLLINRKKEIMQEAEAAQDPQVKAKILMSIEPINARISRIMDNPLFGKAKAAAQPQAQSQAQLQPTQQQGQPTVQAQEREQLPSVPATWFENNTPLPSNPMLTISDEFMDNLDLIADGNFLSDDTLIEMLDEIDSTVAQVRDNNALSDIEKAATLSQLNDFRQAVVEQANDAEMFINELYSEKAQSAPKQKKVTKQKVKKLKDLKKGPTVKKEDIQANVGQSQPLPQPVQQQPQTESQAEQTQTSVTEQPTPAMERVYTYNKDGDVVEADLVSRGATTSTVLIDGAKTVRANTEIFDISKKDEALSRAKVYVATPSGWQAIIDALEKLKVDNKNTLNSFGLLPETWNFVIDSLIAGVKAGQSISKLIDEFATKYRGTPNFDEQGFRDALSSVVPSLRTQQVQELFESDPELANAVYGALGVTDIAQITPQQKQQAIELYSQYLDTIFPDSKVKDIVYHGTNLSNKESILNNGFQTDNKDLSIRDYIFFARSYNAYGNDAYGSNNKTLIPSIIDAKKIQIIEDGTINNSDVKSLFKNKSDALLQILYDINSYKEGKKLSYEQLEEIREKLELNGLNEIIKNTGFSKEKVISELENNFENFIENYVNKYGITNIPFGQLAIHKEKIHILGSKQDIDGFKKWADEGDKKLNIQDSLIADDIEPNNQEQELLEVSTKTGVTPKNLRDLYKIGRDIFGLSRIKSFASAVVMDRMVGAMAKRAGVTKEQMYGRLKFEKDTESNVLKADNALFQGVVDGKPVTLRNMDVDVVNGFYSPIEKNLMEYGKDKIKAKDWLNVVGKGDEAVFTGVRAFLEGKDPNAMVSKQEILDYMKDNRISVVEVVKGGFDDGEVASWWNDEGGANEETPFDELTENEKQQARDRYKDEVDDYSEDAPKFSQYQLEGEKENYKEVLVTLPQSKSMHSFELKEGVGGNWYIENKKTGVKLNFGSESLARQQFEKLSKEPQVDYDKQFRSTHFDEPNILVHLRMNTRTDADGNKVLFLEEVQSDFGQSYKKDIDNLVNFVNKNEEKVIEAYKKNGKLRVEC